MKMNFNNYYNYTNGNQIKSNNYDRQTAELMAIGVMRYNNNVESVWVVSNITGEIVKKFVR